MELRIKILREDLLNYLKRLSRHLRKKQEAGEVRNLQFKEGKLHFIKDTIKDASKKNNTKSALS